MFKIVKDRRAWWPVEFSGVTEEGRTVTNKIELRFLIHPEDEHLILAVEAGRVQDRAEELVKADLEAEGKGRRIEELSDEERGPLMVRKLSHVMAEFVQKIACDWREVGAENGDPLKWEPENIRLLVNVPGVFGAITTAYGKCRLGEKDIRSGN